MGVEFYRVKRGESVVLRTAEGHYVVIQVEGPTGGVTESSGQEPIETGGSTRPKLGPMPILDPGEPPDAMMLKFDTHFDSLNEPPQLAPEEVSPGPVVHGIDLRDKGGA